MQHVRHLGLMVGLLLVFYSSFDSPMSNAEPFSIGQCATLACFLEATAPKPGNVHRGADFDDLTYIDLVTTAIVIGPIMEAAPKQRLGVTIREAVAITQSAVGTNANLGTILLL